LTRRILVVDLEKLQGVGKGEVVALRKIVAGVDGSEHGQRALTWALAEAMLRKTPCMVLHACDIESRGEDTYVPHEEMEEAMAAARAVLARALGQVPEELREGVAVEEHIALSAPADALIAASHDAVLLVVGSRGRSEVKDLLLGSVSTACVHHGRCPIVVVPHEWRDVAAGGAGYE
jgi:nucleotide-binding universal stress UspA family protein